MNKPVVNTIVSGPKYAPSTYQTIVLKSSQDFKAVVESEPNKKYIVKYDFDLGGETVTVPEGCLIEMDGGTISDGTMVGDHTILIYFQDFEDCIQDVTMQGTWKYNNPRDGIFTENIYDENLDETQKAFNARVQTALTEANRRAQAVIPLPDEEDLTTDGGHNIKLKNKAYAPAQFSGLGRNYLRKNIVEIALPFNGFVEDVTLEVEGLAVAPVAICFDSTNGIFVGIDNLLEPKYYGTWLGGSAYNTEGTLADDDEFKNTIDDKYYKYDDGALTLISTPTTKNVLTQAIFSQANTVYNIQYDYDLMGETITIPENCVLEFDGGSLSNGYVVIKEDTLIKAENNYIFKDVEIQAFNTPNGYNTYKQSFVNASWFGANIFNEDNSDYIQNAINSASNIRAKLEFTYGRFNISKPIVIPKLFHISGFGDVYAQRLSSRGHETTFATASEIDCLIQVGTDEDDVAINCVIENLTLLGIARKVNGITFKKGIEHATLKNISMWSVNKGIYCSLSDDKGFTDCIFENVKIDTCNYAIYVEDLTEERLVYVTHNVFTKLNINGCYLGGIYIQCERGVVNQIFEKAHVTNIGYNNFCDDELVSPEVYGFCFLADDDSQNQVVIKDSYLENIMYSYYDERVQDFDYDNTAVICVKNIKIALSSVRFSNTLTVIKSIGRDKISLCNCIDNGYRGTGYEAICLGTNKTTFIMDYWEAKNQEKDIIKGSISNRNVGYVKVHSYVTNPVGGTRQIYDNINYSIDNSEKVTLYIDGSGVGSGLLPMFPANYNNMVPSTINKCFKGVSECVINVVDNFELTTQINLIFAANAKVIVDGNNKTITTLSSLETYTAPFSFNNCNEIEIKNLTYNPEHASSYLVNNSNYICNVFIHDVTTNANTLIGVSDAKYLCKEYLLNVTGKENDNTSLGNPRNKILLEGINNCSNIDFAINAKRGPFSNKPAEDNIYQGFQYFCTDKQTVEGQTNGIAIFLKKSGVWVDALGRTVS